MWELNLIEHLHTIGSRAPRVIRTSTGEMHT